MNIKQLCLQSTQTIALSVAVILSSTTIAAPLKLPNQPVFTFSSVEPNIYFSYDDSTSMIWASIMSPGLLGLDIRGGLARINGVARKYFYAGTGNQSTFPPLYKTSEVKKNRRYTNTGYKNLWAFKNHQANKMAYNPDINYIPWEGIDPITGKAFANSPAENAQIHPVLNKKINRKNTINLLATHTYTEPLCSCDVEVYLPTYYLRADPNAPITLDDNNTVTEYQIRPEINSYRSGRNYAGEIQNFANWYTYYRTRELAAKSAIGRVITNASNVRMGVDFFNSFHNSTANEALNTSISSMSVQANKDTLLSNFQNSTTSNDTRTYESYQRVIAKFRRKTNSPLLSKEEGGECQQNFIILATDGEPYRSTITTAVGNQDENSTNKFDGPPYADTYSNTLADIAMDIYKNDLRLDYANIVPITQGIDEAPHQHIVTYSIAFGLEGLIDRDYLPTDTANFDGWNTNDIDDLYHAAYNGRGLSLSANSPQQLEASLSAAISDIGNRTVSTAAAAVNSAKLTTDTVIYLATFNTSNWSGNLFAHPISDSNTGELAPSKWKDSNGDTAGAATILDEMDYTKRSIFTYNSEKNTGLIFSEANKANFSQIMQNDFNSNIPLFDGKLVDTPTLALTRRNFIRGDRTHEGLGDEMYQTRERGSRLGDIVNSGPVFVGAPNLKWPDNSDFKAGTNFYSDYKDSQSSRANMVYFGSNDGMLHAVADSTGQEAFAYLPNLLSSTSSTKGYHYLSNKLYNHQWYVDLTPSASDVIVGNNWKTVLVGALRGGGRGIFALDITTPESMSNSSVLWEFSANIDTNGDGTVDTADNNDPDLGYTYSNPVIAMANNNKWYAFFGNGYNDTESGTAQLFMVGIEGMNSDGSTDNQWTLGTDYYKINTSAGSTTTPNGLSSPELVDTDGDSKVDRVYAGDLNGNMWAFDLSSATPADWSTSKIFTATGKQPITAKPVVSRHPSTTTDTDNAPNLMVFFGTGKFLTLDDRSNSDSQSFYGVWDKKGATVPLSDMVEQKITETTVAIVNDEGLTVNARRRTLTTNSVNYNDKDGWFITLPTEYERAITAPAINGETLFFNTFIPADDPCNPVGSGFKFAVDLASGGNPPQTVMDTNGDGVIDAKDDNPLGIAYAAIDQAGYLPDPVFVGDLVFTGEKATKVIVTPPGKTGRLSWQELINENH